MKTPVYHVGLFARGKTAVLQYRENLDCLSCEILRYYGKVQTTKKAVRENIKLQRYCFLAYLASEFPRKQFKRIVIE